jgi:hypothetical protein
MDQSHMDKMLDLILDDRRREAVEFYRSITGADLETAKLYIEELSNRLHESHPEVFQDQASLEDDDSPEADVILENYDDLDQASAPAETESQSSSGWLSIWNIIIAIMVIRAIIRMFG